MKVDMKLLTECNHAIPNSHGMFCVYLKYDNKTGAFLGLLWHLSRTKQWFSNAGPTLPICADSNSVYWE